MQGYYCINCNCSQLQISPQTKCPICNHTEIDEYYRLHRSLVMLDILLFRVAAYRHLLKNRFRYYSKNNVLLITILCYFVLILLELFQKHKTLKGENHQDVPVIVFRQLIYLGGSIGFTLGQKIGMLLLAFLLIYFRSLKEKNISLLQICFALVICQYARLSNILFVIWEHSPFLRQMGTLSILLAEISAVRALIEDNQQWIMPTLLVVVTTGVLGSVNQSYFGEGNITIL